MKKILLTLLFLLFFKIDVFATDACDKFLPRDASFIGEATFASNLRDFPCTYKSNVMGVTTAGTTYEIVREVDGWYEIKMENGTTYWIRDQSITKISDIVKPIYTLTSGDKIIINKFIYKVEPVIKEKGAAYRNFLALKISNFIDSEKYSDRLNAILEEIKNRINAIEFQTVEQVEEEIKIELNNTYSLENIDISRVKNTWLDWYNGVRNDLGRDNYSYNSTLEQTALDWSQVSKERGDITHKRDLSDSYYDYDKITSWFKERGVVCKNVNRITHTENIGRGQYSCSDGECTDELIAAIRNTFDYYMAEKNQSYQAHYESIINPYFTIMGLGIELDEIRDNYFKYYLTVHYCTELID